MVPSPEWHGFEADQPCRPPAQDPAAACAQRQRTCRSFTAGGRPLHVPQPHAAEGPPLQFLSGSAEEAVRICLSLHGELPTEAQTLKESMKRLAVPRSALSLKNSAFTYMGPVDGHELAEDGRTFPGGPPAVMGRYWFMWSPPRQGYPLRRGRPRWAYHAQSAFDLQNGARPSRRASEPPSYSKVFRARPLVEASFA